MLSIGILKISVTSGGAGVDGGWGIHFHPWHQGCQPGWHQGCYSNRHQGWLAQPLAWGKPGYHQNVTRGCLSVTDWNILFKEIIWAQSIDCNKVKFAVCALFDTVSFAKLGNVVEIVGSEKRKVGDRERTNAPPVKLATSILIRGGEFSSQEEESSGSLQQHFTLELHFRATAAMFSNIFCFIYRQFKGSAHPLHW